MTESKIRLDKWLWAARFFKTRSIATDMINGGKVHYNGQRCKASKAIDVGAEVKIRQGFDEKVVVIKEVSDKRRNHFARSARMDRTGCTKGGPPARHP